MSSSKKLTQESQVGKRAGAWTIQGIISATESDWINLAEAARAAASTHA